MIIQKVIKTLTILAGAVCLLVPAFAAAQPALLGIEIRGEGSREQVVLQLNENVDYTYFVLPAPERLVINFPTLGGGAHAQMPKNYRGTLVGNIRFGQFDTETSRVVVDLASAVTVANAFTLPAEEKAPLRVVFELEGVKGSVDAPTPSLKPEKLSHEASKPVVVIDAGHGGVDPGALGKKDTQEKNITLAFARALREALLDTGRYRVVLTREDDHIILLRERVAIARKQGGNIFLSLHADSAPTAAARGLSVYTLSEKASDSEAAALAAQENKVDILAGIDLSSESQDVADILIDLARRETMNKSSRLAETLVKHLDRGITRLPNTHRFAGFAVLKAPDIPSVLVEMGFISNRKDEQQLLSREYRNKVVRSLVKGIDSYFDSNHNQ